MWGTQHGYGIGQALRTQSGEVLQVETGPLYPALHRPERAKSDLDDEIESHLALAADKRERDASAEIARREAEREFGNQALVKDVVRRLWGWVWLESLYRSPAG